MNIHIYRQIERDRNRNRDTEKTETDRDREKGESKRNGKYLYCVILYLLNIFAPVS